jgi:flagellar M-ring protein FliF
LSFLQGIFSRIKGWFAGIWEKTEKRDRTRFLVISGVALTLIIAAMVMLNNSRYTELVASADRAQMRAATAALSEGGVRFRPSGNSLLVHRNDHSNALSLLAVTTDTSIDLDLTIYGQATGLTSTDADRKAFSAFQIADNLKRILEGMPIIDTAVITIKMPERRSFFAGEEQLVSVSVFLRRNGEIDPDMVEAIESLVGNATGALPENISIMDQHGTHLNKRRDVDIIHTLGENYAHKLKVEQHLASAARRQLDLLFGQENNIVTVSADIDFDVRSSERVTFTPVVGDEGIPRSTQTSSEFARGLNNFGGFPGTDENGLGMDADEYAEVLDDMRSEYRKNQETINYEINQLNEFLSETPGRLSNVRVSVAINSDGLEPADQNPAAVRELVRASVGLSAADARNDVVVEYLPMIGNRQDNERYEQWRQAQQREEFFELIRALVLYLLIGLCFIILIVKTFNLLKPKPLETMEELFAGDGGDYADMLEAAESGMELEVTKTPTRERVEEFIDSNPEAVASMLRNWLQDEESRGW